MTNLAVYQQRVEPRDSADDFPTPPWAVRAMCEWLIENTGNDLSQQTVLEPACNRGYMARPLSEYFASIVARDKFDYGDEHYPHADECRDFLSDADVGEHDWVITNPPFILAEEFVHKALTVAKVGVVMVLRVAFLEGVRRWERLYSSIPPTYYLQYVERVSMVKGAYDPDASRPVAVCCMVWLKSDTEHDTRLRWIAPCKKRLMRGDDKCESRKIRPHIKMSWYR